MSFTRAANKVSTMAREDWERYESESLPALQKFEHRLGSIRGELLQDATNNAQAIDRLREQHTSINDSRLGVSNAGQQVALARLRALGGASALAAGQNKAIDDAFSARTAMAATAANAESSINSMAHANLGAAAAMEARRKADYQAAKANRRSSLGSVIGGVIGGIGGFAVGGLPGAALGYTAGSTTGSSF